MDISKKSKSIEEVKSIVGDIVESERTTINAKRASKSTINIFPMGNRAIVKNIFEIPASLISKTKDIFESTPLSSQIVAYGCETEEIEIGDEVLVSYHASVERLILPNNKKGVFEMQKNVVDRIKGNFAEISKIKIQMEEYYIVPYFSITGITKNRNIKNEMSWYDAEIGNV